MTEIAVREPAEMVPAEAPSSALVLWAYEARQAAQIAQSLSKTSFVPASLRGKPEDITAAILAGQELGLRPMASLRSMDIIQGTPALRAHAMRGLVQSHGHAVQLVESTDDRCVMRGRRAGEDQWQEVTWTLARAEKLGLTNKDQWKKQPGTMLIARATGEVCRLIASDVLYAMPYAAEELDGMAPMAEAAPAARVTAAEITRGAARAAEPAQPASVPPATDGYDRQLRRMFALFRDVEMTDRDDRLRYTNEVLAETVGPDRRVASSSDLTPAELGHLNNKLQSWADQLEPKDGDQ